jgi:hypothetical protein
MRFGGDTATKKEKSTCRSTGTDTDMNPQWNTVANWTNGLVGAFIGAAAGVTSVTGADAIGAAYGIPAGFSPYMPGGLKKLALVALVMGLQGAFTYLKQHPTPFNGAGNQPK